MTRGFLLDTNVASEQIRPRPDPRLDLWLGAQSEMSLYLSVVTLGELQQGIALKPLSKRRSGLEQWLQQDLLPRFVNSVLPVTQSIAGTLSALRRQAGVPLEMGDGLIAASALDHELTLITRYVKGFARLGLTLLNPWEL